MTPNKNHITAHLHELYHWMIEVMPQARFEIRGLLPSGNDKFFRQFEVTAIDEAAEWAAAKNLLGFNCYVVPNLIRPTAPDRFVSDDRIMCAAFHWIDADGVDTEELNKHPEFPFSMIVLTGQIPRLRLHGYWRMDMPRTDLEMGWRATQSGLAHAFGTDASVSNPSRMMRLGGTLSYPPPHKIERGYVTELTEILVQTGCVDNAKFIAAFQPPAPVYTAPDAAAGNDDAGNVPLCVIRAALAAMEPVGHGCRNDWLATCHSVIDANPTAQHEWYEYDRRCVPHSGRQTIFRQLSRNHTPGGYPRLFKLANEANPMEWWRDGGEVQAWWHSRAEKYYASQATNNVGIKRHSEANMGTVHELFPARKPANQEEVDARASLSKSQADAIVKEKRLAAAEALRQRRIRELSGKQ